MAANVKQLGGRRIERRRRPNGCSPISALPPVKEGAADDQEYDGKQCQKSGAAGFFIFAVEEGSGRDIG